ncbi:hypothetical protein JCM8547_004339 [Rhodosporidiobolus lusitaniae]
MFPFPSSHNSSIHSVDTRVPSPRHDERYSRTPTHSASFPLPAELDDLTLPILPFRPSAALSLVEQDEEELIRRGHLARERRRALRNRLPVDEALFSPSAQTRADRPALAAAHALHFQHHQHHHEHHSETSGRDPRKAAERAANLSLLEALDDGMLEALAGELREIALEAEAKTSAPQREEDRDVEQSAARMHRARMERERENGRRASFPSYAPPASSASRPRHQHQHHHSHSLANPALSSSLPPLLPSPSSPSNPTLKPLLPRPRTPPPPYAEMDPFTSSTSPPSGSLVRAATDGARRERMNSLREGGAGMRRRRTDRRPERVQPSPLGLPESVRGA